MKGRTMEQASAIKIAIKKNKDTHASDEKRALAYFLKKMEETCSPAKQLLLSQFPSSYLPGKPTT